MRFVFNPLTGKMDQIGEQEPFGAINYLDSGFLNDLTTIFNMIDCGALDRINDVCGSHFDLGVLNVS